MFPKRRKLNDNGFVKSSKTLIGSKIGVGSTYLPKYSKPFFLRPAQKYVIDVRSARATVVLISFVGADDKPRVWDKIPQYYVDQRVQNFINENRLTNCFEFIENDNYLKLKCWRDNKLTNVDIMINPGKPKKKHYVNDFLSIVI